MINLAIWDKETNLTLPDGSIKTVEEIFADYPFSKTSTVILEFLPNGNVGAIDDLAILAEIYALPPELTEAEALAKITEIRNAPPTPYADPVEAKLDYLVMNSI